MERTIWKQMSSVVNETKLRHFFEVNSHTTQNRAFARIAKTVEMLTTPRYLISAGSVLAA